MPKRTKTDSVIINMDTKESIEKVLKPYDMQIIGASISDGYCNYSYEITIGPGVGNPHNVKGKHVVTDDLKNAFAKFNVHLAIIDDAFKHAGIEFESIEQIKNDQLVFLYEITGFKVQGSEENESIILMGNKYSNTVKSRIELKTDKILIDGFGGYQWYNELKEVSDEARMEVKLYDEGKYVQDETVEIVKNPNQLTIGDEIEDFESNRV
jgi:hypothetical protein